MNRHDIMPIGVGVGFVLLLSLLAGIMLHHAQSQVSHERQATARIDWAACDGVYARILPQHVADSATLSRALQAGWEITAVDRASDVYLTRRNGCEEESK